jgi:hypothetical protein
MCASSPSVEFVLFYTKMSHIYTLRIGNIERGTSEEQGMVGAAGDEANFLTGRQSYALRFRCGRQMRHATRCSNH